jgi:hypothetical protein
MIAFGGAGGAAGAAGACAKAKDALNANAIRRIVFFTGLFPPHGVLQERAIDDTDDPAKTDRQAD